ncbi:MAG: hypothetical protein NT154_26010, partial [Verrucomicrobia bacterium]|nr:hypothetical protein [Verrucomicrobiota bacterium]
TILAIGTAVQAADATGTWTWTRPGRNGGADMKLTLKLKADGEKLTGTLTSPNRDGGTTDTAIADGKVKGEEVSFTVTREFNGNTMATARSAPTRSKAKSRANGMARPNPATGKPNAQPRRLTSR